MGIRIEQPGAAKAAAGAGVAIGKGQRAEEGRARAAQQQAQAASIKAQQAAQQKAMEFDLFKMEQRSLQDFQQELRTKQYEFDKFNRAKEWDIEKMELASRMDFQQSETKRLREIDLVTNKELAVRKDIDSGVSTEKEHELTLLNLKLARDALETGGRRPAPLTQMPQDRQERQEFGAKPYWMDPDIIDTTHGQAMQARSEGEQAQELAAGRYDLSVEAAGRAQSAEARAQESHEKRMAGETDSFTQFKQLDELTQIVSGFEEDATINPGAFTLGTKKVPLAIRNNKGKLIEATPAEAQLYQEAKARLGQRTQTPQEGAPPSPTTQTEYDAIPSGTVYKDSTGNMRTKK